MEGGQCACASSAWQHSVQAFVKWRTKHTSTRVITEETTLMMGTATVRVALMMNVMTRSRTPSSNCNNRRGLVAPLCGHVTSYRRGRKAWPHSMSIGNFFFFFCESAFAQKVTHSWPIILARACKRDVDTPTRYTNERQFSDCCVNAEKHCSQFVLLLNVYNRRSISQKFNCRVLRA